MARARRQTEAERLRRHNEEMKLALAENITVIEARRRLAACRWREFEEGLERRRRCGTADERLVPAEVQNRTIPMPPQARSQYWWERD